MVESSSSSKPQPDSMTNESVDPDNLNVPDGELEGVDEEGVESDEYDVVDDEEEEEDSDEDEDEDAEEGNTLTHLLLGNINKLTRSGEIVDNREDDDDDDDDDDEDEDEDVDEDDDYAFVPGGGIEPAEEELDGYARDPAPTSTIISGGKRARDEDEDAATAVNGDAKRAKA